MILVSLTLAFLSSGCARLIGDWGAAALNNEGEDTEVVDSTSSPFVTRWNIASDGETLTLPLRSGFNYDFTVEWGDGSAESVVTSFDDSDKAHTYTSAGEYTVRITGVVEAVTMFDTPDDPDRSGLVAAALQLIEVVDLGDVGWKSLRGAFAGADNLESLSGGVTDQVTDMSYAFYSSMDNGGSLDFSTWDTRSVTEMSGMFQGLTTVHDGLNVSNFDTRNVTNMSSMFANCGEFELDLSNFDTGQVTNMSSMFEGSHGLAELVISNWNTGAVTNMSRMFLGANGLSELDLSAWDASAVTDISFMFAAQGFVKIDLSGWNTQNVTDMSYLFAQAQQLRFIYANSWDLSNVVSSDLAIYDNHSTLVIYCDQGGSPGTGSFFGQPCATVP